jgi:tripartite-type tricarboxylate transporter receptor subunit TctC
LPGYVAELHYGLVAPGGTSPDIIAKLNAVLNDALADGGVRDGVAVDGAVTLPGTPQAYADDIAGEEAKWATIIRSTGVEPQ